MMKNILVFFSLALLFSCAIQHSKTSNSKIFWVNSAKVPCEGLVPMHCLQVKKGDASGAWERFYSEIEGFDFRPGYVYKLSVTETRLNPKNVPADGSSIRYTLVEILEKKQDGRLRLYDIWALEAIGDKPFKPTENQVNRHPTLELNTTENHYFGNDGCNDISGKIEKADSKNLIFGISIGTEMACPNMELSDRFNRALEKVKTYEIAKLRLVLFDENGEEVLRFRKVD